MRVKPSVAESSESSIETAPHPSPDGALPHSAGRNGLFRWSLALLALLSVSLRWAFRGRWLEGWDSVNFALGVQNFDPLHHQPHFPGYPVYIAAAQLFHALGADPVTALALTSAIGGGLAVVPLALLAREVFGFRVALLSGLLFAVNPLLWLEAEKIYSDSFGLLLLLSTVAAMAFGYAKGRGFYLSGVLMGLTLGVRLSYFPFLLPLFAACFRSTPGANVLRVLNGGVLGVGLWALPLLLQFPSTALLQAGGSHAEGHFNEWGGSVVTDPDGFSRAFQFLWNVGPNGLGFWWPDAPQPAARALLTLIALPALVRGLVLLRAAGWLMPFLWATLPYGAWVFLGQNLTSVRHVMPLVALALPVLAAGLIAPLPATRTANGPLRKGAQHLAALACLLLSFGVALPLAAGHSRQPPTRVQAADYLKSQYDPRTTRLLTWNSARVLEWYAPEWRQRILGAVPVDLPEGERVLALSDYPKLDALRQAGYELKLIRRFERSRYLHTWFYRLDLYEVQRATPPASTPSADLQRSR